MVVPSENEGIVELDRENLALRMLSLCMDVNSAILM